MSYDESWCEELTARVGAGGGAVGAEVDLTVLYVVTDTDEGKVAFHIVLPADTDAAIEVRAGKLPRGTKPDITVTAKEALLRSIWAGEVSRDSAFMAGDIKVEGAYGAWLDQLVPSFEAEPWASAWAQG